MLNTYKNDLKEHLLVDLHELLVPLIDVGSLLAGVRIIVVGLRRITLVVNTPLDNFVENSLVDLVDLSQPGAEVGGEQREPTLGIGIASVKACSPMSSIMFLMRMDLHATSLSVQYLSMIQQEPGHEAAETVARGESYQLGSRHCRCS